MHAATFDLETVNRFILHKQHLDGNRATASIVEVARRIGGLHNTGSVTPHLSLFARVPGFTSDLLFDEMYERRSLVRIRCMRNTMHILPRDLLPVAFMATRKVTCINAERYLDYHGLDGDEYNVLSDRITALLAARGMTIVELKKALGHVTGLPAVLTLMCDRGILVRGETPHRRSNAYTYHLFSEYLPDLSLESIDEREAVAQLARLYFAAFGPAKPDDFAWWSGLGKTVVKKVIDGMPVDRVRIRGLDGDFVLLPDDLQALNGFPADTGTHVSLLPGLDPYVMGYKVRDRYLPEEHYGYVFDRAGNSTNTVVVNGRMAGAWDCPADEPMVKYFLFGETGETTRTEIRVKAKRAGEFIHGRPVTVKECRSMVPLAQRNAGGFMSPLKDQ